MAGGSKRSRDEFRQLYTECISALEIYVAEAGKLCQMLSACNGCAVNAADHVALIAQRQRESDAHAEYALSLAQIVTIPQLLRRPPIQLDNRIIDALMQVSVPLPSAQM